MRIGARIARALEKLHFAGWIPKDIKPHKVMLSARGDDVTLIDLGIALRVRDQLLVPRDQMEGTLAYVAPERLPEQSALAEAQI